MHAVLYLLLLVCFNLSSEAVKLTNHIPFVMHQYTLESVLGLQAPGEEQLRANILRDLQGFPYCVRTVVCLLLGSQPACLSRLNCRPQGLSIMQAGLRYSCALFLDKAVSMCSGPWLQVGGCTSNFTPTLISQYSIWSTSLVAFNIGSIGVLQFLSKVFSGSLTMLAPQKTVLPFLQALHCLYAMYYVVS